MAKDKGQRPVHNIVQVTIQYNNNNNNNSSSIARAGNELHKRKQKRKATEKEKKILKDLKQQLEESDTTSKNIRRYKEKWLDQLRYKKMKLEKMIERGNRVKDNANFEKDQKAFLRLWKQRLSMKENHHGWNSLLNSGLGYGKKMKKTPEMPWMEKVKIELGEKVQNVNKFTITEDKVVAEIRKRKNWTAPGIDGIQNYWWKRFETAQKALTRAFERRTNAYDMIPVWWPTGRTVQIPKTKDLSNEQEYHPITCLNISYKMLDFVLQKYLLLSFLNRINWQIHEKTCTRK